MSAALEQRIIAALDAEIGSNDLAALIEETEAAIIAADETAAVERERALDPALSTDPAEARAAMEDATFTANRLRTLLPRLQRRHQEVVTAERLQQWRADYEIHKVKRDTLAEEFREAYPRAVSQLVDLLARMAANDAELSQLHLRRAAGVSLHLRSAELEARNLESFSRDAPSITTELRLPDWDHPPKMAWPPPQTSLAVLAAQGIAALPHPGAHWWEGREQRAAAQRAEQERVAQYYADLERPQNEGEKAAP